jgi:hypothetical protein
MMMHILKLVACTTLPVVVLLASSLAGGQQPGTPPPFRGPLPPMHLPPTAPQGSPAITPHLPGTPSFTLDDVRQFVASQKVLKLANRDLTPRLMRADFMDSGKVSVALNGATTGFPPGYMLCLVELQGPFSFTGPPGATAVYPRGVLVFDATTGNLVITGGLP